MGEDRPAADDLERRTRVRALIEGARRQSTDTDRPRSRPPLRAMSGPDCLPGYEMMEEVHRGGQGVVYRARQRSTGRTVAIKIMHEGPFSGPRDRERFEREVHVLAQLDHPNIVGVLDSGTAGGSAYFVMDYIDGVPFDQYVQKVEKSKSRKVETQERLRLFAKVCDAVHAAHLRGIIHRDLKPNNVLVDTTGEPHILDFGLAKLDATDAGGEAAETVTTVGQFVGSLPWASPEQAAGESGQIDIRTDVYSLGVMLYQTLTGRFPYSVVGNMRDVLDHIMTAEPVPLRQRAAGFTPALFRRESARGAHTSAGVNPAARFIDDELETIVLRCLNKERERRYQSAGDLGRDIRHYLADEPIEAKRDSTWYVLKKTLKRYRGRAAAAGAFVLLVSGASVSLSILYARQGVLMSEVQGQRDKAREAEQLADERFRHAEYESYLANIAAADAAIAVNDGGSALRRLEQAPPALRNWEWHHLIRQADQSIATWHGPEDLMTVRVELSRHGGFVGALFWMEEREDTLRVWSRASGNVLLELSHSGPFEFVGGGDQLLVCDYQGTLLRFDLADRRETARRKIAAWGGDERASVMRREGEILLTQVKGGCRVRDTVANRALLDAPAHGDVRRTASSFDATGARLALGYSDGTVTLWDVTRGRELDRIKAHTTTVYGVAHSFDGRMLATAGGETGELKLWDASQGREASLSAVADPHAAALHLRRELHDGGQRVGIISFSPDGNLLAAPSADKTVRIWSVADGKVRTTLLGHTTGVACTAFGSDGRFLVSGAHGGEVKLWDLQQRPSVRVFPELPGPLNSVAFAPDGTRLLFNCSAPYVIELASGRCSQELNVSLALPGCRAILLGGPDGSHAATPAADGAIHFWKLASGEESRIIGSHKTVPVIAGDPAGRVLASVDAEAVVMWDWADGRELRRFAGPGEPVSALAISSDAARLALGLPSGKLIICDTQTGERAPIDAAHSDAIMGVAFSPNGRTLATASDDQTVKLWGMADRRVAWTASPQMGDVWCVAFSPDGTRLAVGGRDRSVRIFDSATGRELLALRGPTGTVMCVAFSPDGRSIAAGSWAREVFVWDAGG